MCFFTSSPRVYSVLLLSSLLNLFLCFLSSLLRWSLFLCLPVCVVSLFFVLLFPCPLLHRLCSTTQKEISLNDKVVHQQLHVLCSPHCSIVYTPLSHGRFLCLKFGRAGRRNSRATNYFFSVPVCMSLGFLSEWLFLHNVLPGTTFLLLWIFYVH